MTQTGLLLIPLGFLAILLPWRFSFPALFVFSVMKSSAVINAGSFGLQPGYFYALLMIGRCVVEIALFRHPLNLRVATMLIPLICFVMICFVVTWIGLAFFQGKVMVISSTVGLNLDLIQPYQLQRQNFTQLFYILLNVTLVYVIAHQIARMPRKIGFNVIGESVNLAIWFASLVCLWELAAFHSGIGFADGFFHSNAGYAQAHGQVLGGTVLRVSGPFSEPSALAYFYAGATLFAWYRYLAEPSIVRMALVLLCLAIMTLSTSTTAFLFVGLFCLFVIKDLVWSLVPGGRTGAPLSRHLGGISLVGLGGLAATAFILANWNLVDDVLTRMLFQKTESSSFEQRSNVDRLALDIALQTGGIGIGLGSHRPNNMAMTLLSNTGVAGLLTFGFLIFRVFFGGRKRDEAAPGCADACRPFQAFLLGLLIVHCISNPNLNEVVFWIILGTTIGLLVLSSRSEDGRLAASGSVPAISPIHRSGGVGATA